MTSERSQVGLDIKADLQKLFKLSGTVVPDYFFRRCIMSKAVQKITIDKEKTFSCLSNNSYRLPDQLWHELMKTARSLVESGKDTMLVRWGNGMEKMLIDSFLSLRGEYPKLRLIKLTYENSFLNHTLTELADGLIIYLNLERQTIEDFMFQNSSTVVCYMSQAGYCKSRLKKYYEKQNCLEVINLYRPTISSEMEQDLYRLVGSGEYTPQEIAERILDWKPCIPSRLSKRAAEFKNVLEALCSDDSDNLEKMKEINTKMLTAASYYFYLVGYKDSEEKEL